MARQSLQTLRPLLSALTGGPGFDRVGQKLKLVSASEGKCSFELKLDEEHLNRGGALHGGLTAYLVDISTTLALMMVGSGLPGVSTDLHVTFIKAARAGETIQIDAECLKVGRTLGFTTCDIKNESGTLIAQGRHTKFLSSPTSNSDYKK